MTIKEAFSRRNQLDKEKGVKQFHFGSKDYDNKVFRQGKKLLQKARIPAMLGELREIISATFPDARIIADESPSNAGVSDPKNSGDIFTYCDNGITSIYLGWKFTRDTAYDSQYRYSAIIVQALPLTNELIVGDKIIQESAWDTENGKTILENAIVHAYRNPLYRLGPLGRI